MGKVRNGPARGRPVHFGFTGGGLPLPRFLSRFLIVAAALATALPPATALAQSGKPRTRLEKILAIPRFREELRLIVDGLAQYAESRNPRFLLVGRMPLGLMATSSWEQQRETLVDPTALDRDPVPDSAPGAPFRRILHDLDAVALDDANCPKPPPKPDAPKPTRAEEMKTQAFAQRIAAVRAAGTPVLSLDSCAATDPFAAARRGAKAKTLSIAAIGTPDAPKRLVKGRPPFENSTNVDNLGDVKNGIWLRGPRAYPSKDDWVMALGESNADLVIVDAFYAADKPLTKEDVRGLKYKHLGARRLLLAEVDLTAARDDRYYWKRGWKVGDPAFLREPLPGMASGILVDYWMPEWKEILGAYFKGLMDLGFDGVLLEGLNAADRLEYEVFLE